MRNSERFMQVQRPDHTVETIVSTIVLIAIVSVIIWAVITLVRHFTKPAQTEGALSIARKRYASGEIDEKAFKQLRKDLAEK